MTEKIPEAQLHRLTDMVARRLGLHFPENRWPDLQRAVCAAAPECGYPNDVDRYVQELLVPTLTPGHLEVLASHLTVGETYFFREKRSLEVLEKHILPELMQTRTGRAIRIWSAGCATGEEPYSIAILLSKWMAGADKWDIEILATDLNFKSLQKASEGIYREWSFRGTPMAARSAYFELVDKDRWAIRPAIKKMVSFAHLNLADDSSPWHANFANGFDVIFCRNVLMYFTSNGKHKVVGQLYRSLASNGWLIVSPTETSHELFPEFAAVSFGDVTLYRKSAPQPRMALALPSVALDKNCSGHRLPIQKVESAESAAALVCDPGKKTEDAEIHAENAEPPTPSYAQALVLYELGRYEEAELVVGKILSHNGKDAPALLLLARGCANQGKLAAALVWCDQAIAADKMNACAYYLRATILREQGSIPEVLLALKQAVYVEPQFVLSHFSLGHLALSQGKLKEAEKHFENVLLLLAQYAPEDMVPESEGLSAGTLREMIVSQHAGMPETEVLRAFGRTDKLRVQPAGVR